MATYRIPVKEVSYGVVVVEAKNHDHAKQIVLDGLFDGTEDYYWFDSNNEYFVDDIEEMDE